MTPYIRTTDFDARLIRGLVGTTVTTYDLVSDGASPESTSPAPSTEPSRGTTSAATPSAPAASPMTIGSNSEVTLVLRIKSGLKWIKSGLSWKQSSASSGTSRTWVITEKLIERAAHLTEHDVKMVRGSPITVAKCLCHLAEDPKQIAFMRIYYQIPISGTEDADNDTLARQAVPPGVSGELECFKRLQGGGCSAVPRFLGHAERIQGEHELLPGGYVRYIVWEKVPGEPLTEEFFWGLGDTARKDIRSKFRAAYEQVLSCGVKPGQARLSKIIFDQSTGNLHISGWRRGWPIFGKLEWSDGLYVAYGLANPSKGNDWHLHAEKWEW